MSRFPDSAPPVFDECKSNGPSQCDTPHIGGHKAFAAFLPTTGCDWRAFWNHPVGIITHYSDQLTSGLTTTPTQIDGSLTDKVGLFLGHDPAHSKIISVSRAIDLMTQRQKPFFNA